MAWENTEIWKKSVEDRISHIKEKINSLENVSLSSEGKTLGSIEKEAKMKFYIRNFFGNLINNFSEWFDPYCKLIELTEEQLENNDTKDKKNGKFTSVVYGLMKETRENLHKLRQTEQTIANGFLKSSKEELNLKESDNNEKIIKKFQDQFEEILKRAKQNLTKIKKLGKEKNILLLNSLRNSVAYGGDKNLNDRHKTSFLDVLNFVDNVLDDEKNWLNDNMDETFKKFEDLLGKLSEPFGSKVGSKGRLLANVKSIQYFCSQSTENISSGDSNVNEEIVDSFLKFKNFADSLFNRAFSKFKNDIFEQIKSKKFDISKFESESKVILKYIKKKIDTKYVELIKNKYGDNNKEYFQSLRDVIVENAICKCENLIDINDYGSTNNSENSEDVKIEDKMYSNFWAGFGVCSIFAGGFLFFSFIVESFANMLAGYSTAVAAASVGTLATICLGVGVVVVAGATAIWIGYKIFRRIKEKKIIKKFEDTKSEASVNK